MITTNPMSSKILTVRPLSFLDQQGLQETGDEIVVPQTVLTEWLDLFAPGTSLLVRLTNLENDLSRIVAIGSSDSSQAVYVPRWILEHLALGYDEQVVSVEPFTQEIPPAIRICLRPLDNAAYHSDLRTAFERHLDRFHVMEAGTTLSVPLEELGNYEICAFVEAVEPPGLVRLGGEVQIEFLEPEGGIPEQEPVEEPEQEPEPEPVNAAVPSSVSTLTPAQIREARLKRFANLNASP
jgi:hypothetical protein